MSQGETKIFNEISKSISNLEPLDQIIKLVEKALKQKFQVAEIIEKGLKQGLDEVGARYEKGEYFLSELLYAGEIMTSLFSVLKPHMKQDDVKQRGTILLGTVRGDMHDIGKNIFGMIAQFSGFKINDLGVDVDPNRFIEEAKFYILGFVSADILNLKREVWFSRLDSEQISNAEDYLNKHALNFD